MSPSVTGKSLTERRSSRRSISAEKDRGSPPRRRERSPIANSRRSRSPSRRELSPARHKSSHRDRGGSPPPRERHSGQVKSPKREKMSFPVSRSQSPRTKRLRAHAEKDIEKSSERDNERNHEKGNDKSKRDRSYREKDSEMEAPKDRRERRSERENERPRDRDRTRDREPDKDRERNVVEHASSKSKLRRSESPSDLHHRRSRHHSRSPPSRSRARDEDEGSRGAEHGDDESDAVAQMKAAEQALETKDKQKPSFELSGKLADETNRVRGVTLLFNEPPDARKPDVRWRLYVFKGGDVLNEPLYVHRQSCYLFGRERRVADIPTDHPSCSKQHAVLQYRQVEVERPDGMMSNQIKPYLMDLGSTNKTFINEAPIEPQRYYELFEKDTIKFGNSSREYVLLHENSSN